MAKFRFSLETPLRLREDAEQAARDELMRRSFRQRQEQQKFDGLIDRRAEVSVELAAKQAEGMVLDELVDYRLYLGRLDHETENSRKRLAALRLEVETQKKAVIEAARKRKTLSSLRDKKEKEFNLALERSLQKEIDDLVALRHKRPEPPAYDAAETFG